MSEGKSNTVIDLLSVVLSETSSATMDENPLEYFAFRGALFDLSKAYELANLAIKDSKVSDEHNRALGLRDQLKVLVDKYIRKNNKTTPKLPSLVRNSAKNYTASHSAVYH